MLAGITGTVIIVNLTVLTCGTRLAVALVSVNHVNTATSVLAGITLALAYLLAADGAHITWETIAVKGSNSIYTFAMMTGLGFTVVDVFHTQRPCETFSTFTLVTVRTVKTLGTIMARSAGTLIDVHLTRFPSETLRTLADESADLV